MDTRIIGPGGGETLGPAAGCRDRFLIDAAATGGRFALLEHLLAPRAIAAPLHRHEREDEYSFILEGRVGAVFGDTEVVAEVGDLVFKPRGEWHTFWNAGDEPARLLEIISPGGLEAFFRAVDLAEDPDSVMAGALADTGCVADFERTAPIMEAHGLTWG